MKASIKSIRTMVCVIILIFSFSTVSYAADETCNTQKNDEIHYYHYSQLDEKERKIYDFLYESIITFDKKSIVIEGINEQDYEKIGEVLYTLDALLQDKPTLKGFINEYPIFIEGKFTLELVDKLFEKPVTLEDLKNIYNTIGEKTDNIIKSMPENLTEYDKYKYLADSVCDITEYSPLICETYDPVFNNYKIQTAYGVFIDGSAVCEGYSFAYQYLCNKANLFCVKVDFYTVDGIGHSFNIIKLSDGSYYVDTTWMDSGYNQVYNNDSFVFTKDNCLISQYQAYFQTDIANEDFIANGKLYIK